MFINTGQSKISLLFKDRHANPIKSCTNACKYTGEHEIKR